MPPKPGLPPSSLKRWFQERPSEYAWEQDGLDFVQRHLPNAEPFRAWATFSFTAQSGRIHECDLLVATPGGLYLLELKAHPGRVTNRGDDWLFHEQGREWPRTLRNPLHFTDLKSKELKQRLERAAQRRKMKMRIPRVEPAIFLTHPGLVSQLDEVQRTRVYGRDEASEGLDWIWRDLLSRPPQSEHRRVTPIVSQELQTLLSDIGIRAATAHLRFGDDWTLAPSLLDAGPAWEDRLASRSGMVTENGRVRIYLTEEQAGAERTAQVERAAKREYQVLQGITHRGIAQPVLIREHQGRPAILFRHDPADLRLDSYLALHGAELTPETRLEMVRQLAEAVRYAHSRSLYHRALSARSVYVSARPDGRDPVLRVIDWQTAARDFDAGVHSSIGVSSLGDDVVADSAGPYLAPEFDAPYPDPGDLDMFGLGAIAYLILTGQPPAPDRASMIERVRTDGGLHLHGVDSTFSQTLDDLVFAATRANVDDRMLPGDGFLLGLDRTERDSARPEQPQVDPLTATAGQRVDGEWTVERVLGTGSTARALLVQRPRETEDGEESEYRVLKVALDEQKAESLRSEAEVLERVGGAQIVRKLGGPRTLAGRTVVDLQYAGGFDLDGGTLGTLLRSEGRLSYHDLERFGRDLFNALDVLAGAGVRHRDIKPDNLAIFRRADRSRQLMLLDFSLAGASEKDVKVGTRGYLDPFLDTPRRPVYDDHAERYAAAVTLHEMASKHRPEWGDGLTDPRTTADETPTLAADEFDPALKDGLIAFFQRALHRDVGRRFDTLKQMDDAWRAVFSAADQRVPGETEAEPEEVRDTLAAAATLDTTLEQAGLSPRAVSVAANFGAGTVRELLGVRTTELARARGAGAAVRKELIRRHKQWAVLAKAPEPAEVEIAKNARFTVEELAALLSQALPKTRSKGRSIAEATLGLNAELPPWPSQAAIAKAVAATPATVSSNQRKLFASWAESPQLADVRETVVELLAGAGRVMTATELAGVLRARLGSSSDDHVAARAAVRAAVEAELWAGEQSGAEDGTGDPRLAVIRRGDRVLVALESLVGTDDPTPSELGDFALALGVAADELAVEEPLPGRTAVLRRLREVPLPDGMAALPDTRLVGLASAASRDALVSPNGELYPRGLDLVAALRLSQAAAGVRRKNPGARFPTGITVDALLGRVRARFPEIRLARGLTHVTIAEALREAGFALEYDTIAGRFYPEAPPAPLASSTSMPMPSTPTPTAGLRRQLDRAVEHGGFVALTLRAKELPGAAETISETWPVRTLDVTALFLTELRGIASERGRDWPAVVRSDLKFTETGQLSRGLDSWVRLAWERTGERIDAEAAPGVLVFLHRAGLLARYENSGGRDLLVRLQAAARSPHRDPHGLWLLCPGESAVAAPQLDGMVVEVVDGSERIVLERDQFTALRGRASGVA